ncbi:MAG: helix-turn-helix domain-containing protein [Cyanobacterium sp. T60_A2020_053]|nr:helix-turn-helix domain-containing protein [Cyanobacterium sp. T60_A2020_053]
MNFFKSKEQDTIDPEQERQEFLNKISSVLKNQRNALDYDLDTISHQTKITLTVLRALENADLSLLPEPVFTKELIKKYANFLHLDGENLVLNFNLDKKVVVEQKYFKQRKKFNFNLKINTKYLYVVYGLLIFVSMGSLNDILQPNFFIIDNSSDQQINTNDKLVTQEINSNNSENNQAITAAEKKADEPKKIDELNVKIKAQDDSWIRIVVDGEKEFEGILKKGTEREWKAKKELTIRAGNAGGILLSVNEETPQKVGQIGQVEEITLNL